LLVLVVVMLVHPAAPSARSRRPPGPNLKSTAGLTQHPGRLQGALYQI
jgi:hypothetical protein